MSAFDGVAKPFSAAARLSNRFAFHHRWKRLVLVVSRLLRNRVGFISTRIQASIGSSAFAKCSGLESIGIPASVDVIGTSCFDRCDSLLDAVFDSPVHLGKLCCGTIANCASPHSICLLIHPGLSHGVSTSGAEF
jgi:hypothetical protein